MSRPLPENLKQTHALLGRQATETMFGDHTFTVDGVEFVSGYKPESTSGRFYIIKSAEMLQVFEEFLDGCCPTRIFELGIAEGGSTALLALRPGMQRLVAIDNEVNRLPALDEFIDQRDLKDVVRAHYGVDQSDRGALAEIVEHDFADGAPDLVIDDASHRYQLTRASFECLFPRLQPGGWYLVEDWAQRLALAEQNRGTSDTGREERSSQPEFKAAFNRMVPLERLALEFTMAVGARPDAIDRIIGNSLFVAVRRGPAELDLDEFRLDDLTQSDAQVGLLAPVNDA